MNAICRSKSNDTKRQKKGVVFSDGARLTSPTLDLYTSDGTVIMDGCPEGMQRFPKFNLVNVGTEGQHIPNVKAHRVLG